jgi:hypothetical protein
MIPPVRGIDTEGYGGLGLVLGWGCWAAVACSDKFSLPLFSYFSYILFLYLNLLFEFNHV